MIINSRPIHSHRSKTGYTLIELLVSLSVLGILVGIGFNSVVEFYQQRRLRSAALEVIDLIQKKRAEKVAQLPSASDCLPLNPADPSSQINRDMITTITDLGVRTASGGTPPDICFTSEGLVREAPITLVLSSPAVASQGDWCVVISSPFDQPRLNWRPNGQSSCRPDAAGGSL